MRLLKNGCQIKNKKSSSEERFVYFNTLNFESLTCLISSTRAQIKRNRDKNDERKDKV